MDVMGFWTGQKPRIFMRQCKSGSQPSITSHHPNSLSNAKSYWFSLANGRCPVKCLLMALSMFTDGLSGSERRCRGRGLHPCMTLNTFSVVIKPGTPLLQWGRVNPIKSLSEIVLTRQRKFSGHEYWKMSPSNSTDLSNPLGSCGFHLSHPGSGWSASSPYGCWGMLGNVPNRIPPGSCHTEKPALWWISNAKSRKGEERGVRAMKEMRPEGSRETCWEKIHTERKQKRQNRGRGWSQGMKEGKQKDREPQTPSHGRFDYRFFSSSFWAASFHKEKHFSFDGLTSRVLLPLLISGAFCF